MTAPCNARYEYKFIRLGEGFMGARRDARDQYQEAVHQCAREGWRLVQIFAPGTAVHGSARYFELILERELPPQHPSTPPQLA